MRISLQALQRPVPQWNSSTNTLTKEHLNRHRISGGSMAGWRACLQRKSNLWRPFTRSRRARDREAQHRAGPVDRVSIGRECRDAEPADNLPPPRRRSPPRRGSPCSGLKRVGLSQQLVAKLQSRDFWQQLYRAHYCISFLLCSSTLSRCSRFFSVSHSLNLAYTGSGSSGSS